MNVVSTDEEVIANIRSGNRRLEDKALTWIYRTYFDDLSQWLGRQGLPTTVDAADVFQYGLMAFYRMAKAPDFVLAKSSSIKTLLFAICKNRRKNEWRSHFRHEKAVGQLEQEETTDDIVEQVEIKERDSFVADLISQLSNRCQQMMNYFYFEKKKHLEIAELIGFSSAQLSRNALLKCRKNLNKLIVSHPNWREWIK